MYMSWSTGDHQREFTIILFSGILVIGAALAYTSFEILIAESQLVMRDESSEVMTLSDLATYPFTSPGKVTTTRKYTRGFYRPCDTFRNCSFTPDITTSSSTAIPTPFISTGQNRENDSLHKGPALIPFGGIDTVYLACDSENQRCLCQEHWGLAYKWNQRDWSLNWDAHDLTCTISKGGPCGARNGLQVKCTTPTVLECLEGRCRERHKVGMGQAGDDCDDDLDCSHALSCLYPVHQRPFGKKRCVGVTDPLGKKVQVS